MENWIEIKGYGGLYEVSDLGNVRNSDGKLKKLYLNERGYLKVGLWMAGKRRNWRVNRLVAEAFIPNPMNLAEVNHKSRVKTDNSVSNLEWMDSKANKQHWRKIAV